MASLTIIGIGNRLRGDDGVGPLLIDALKSKSDPRLELIEVGSDALGILEYFPNRENVILVDACRMAREPGTLLSFSPSEAKLIIDSEPLSLHGLGLAETLEMAEAMQMLPDNLKIIGIEPDSIQFTSQLSQPVQRALKLAIDNVYDELHQLKAHAELRL